MQPLDEQRVRIVVDGKTFTFIPGSDIVYKCKAKCGYVGRLKWEQQEWVTSISRG